MNTVFGWLQWSPLYSKNRIITLCEWRPCEIWSLQIFKTMKYRLSWGVSFQSITPHTYIHSYFTIYFYSDPQHFPFHLLFYSHTPFTVCTQFSTLFFSCPLYFCLSHLPVYPLHFSFCLEFLNSQFSVLCVIGFLTMNYLKPILFYLTYIVLSCLPDMVIAVSQRRLLGTAFLCWCLGDLGELSWGGHCGLVSFMSSSTLKVFFAGWACGGHTTDILLVFILVSSIDFKNSFSRVSAEPMLLCEIEYLQSSCSGEGISLPLSVNSFCPSPLSWFPLDLRSCL